MAQAQEYVASSRVWVVDMDLEKFFDRVNHDILMGLVAKWVTDKRILKLIRAFLTAGVLEGGLVSPTGEGTPQGGPLSPLLSNLMLDVLDRELEKRGHRFVRYADDCNIYVRSQRAGERVMESVERFLTKRLKLKVNECRCPDRASASFWGLASRAGKSRGGPIAPQRPAAYAPQQGRDPLADHERVVLLSHSMASLFRFCQTPSVLRDLDQWTRRRTACDRLAAMEARAHTLSERDAAAPRRGPGFGRAQIAGSPHGPWASATVPPSIALTNTFLRSPPSDYARRSMFDGQTTTLGRAQV